MGIPIAGPELIPVTSVFTENVKKSYADFVKVLFEAYKQTASGKGNERHGKDTPWREQPMMTELRQMKSPVGPIFQARKKLLESLTLAEQDPKRAYAEVLGAIVYAAAAAQFFRGDEEAKG